MGRCLEKPARWIPRHRRSRRKEAEAPVDATADTDIDHDDDIPDMGEMAGRTAAVPAP